jgi:ribonuclease P protein component
MGTIRTSREIDRVFKTANRAAHPLLTVLTAHTPEGRGHEGRVAFVAGKRLGGAVCRNRLRRVLRQAVRRAEGPWSGWDVLVVARPGTAAATVDVLDEALKSLLRRSGVIE